MNFVLRSLFIGFFAGLIALALARSMFRDSDRGLNANQFLFAGLIWFIFMVGAYAWQYYGLPSPLVFLPRF